ncbi:ribonuclease III family protein [Metamycoplasma orale]|uniref:ribonuclease III family protein n=1 Tax=Metamycoplasma orale TaxID=2121 RepID=UPI0013EB6456|nr:ribonuclease III family protein [Metamycoplasma orale]
MGIDLKGININTFCEALTHTTFSNEHKNVQNFEYLEFLGDAIIEFVVTAEIYKRFPNYNEGMATQHRISIVNNHTLSTISRKLKIIDNIRTGNKAFINGQNEKVDSDFFEAFIAALYVEKGLDFATKFLLKTLKNIFIKSTLKRLQILKPQYRNCFNQPALLI